MYNINLLLYNELLLYYLHKYVLISTTQNTIAVVFLHKPAFSYT